jgi:hypothetical protein
MISKRLAEDMKVAMKAGDKIKLGVIRMLRAELKNAQIAAGDTLSEEIEEKVLSSYAKKLKESKDQYLGGGRKDLADKEETEYNITMSYLPPRMEEDELAELIKTKVKETGAAGVRDFGAVMKAVMQSAGSRADGSVVSGMVKKLLSGG